MNLNEFQSTFMRNVTSYDKILFARQWYNHGFAIWDVKTKTKEKSKRSNDRKIGFQSV